MPVPHVSLGHGPQRREVGRHGRGEIVSAQLPVVAARGHREPGIEAVVGLAVEPRVSRRSDTQQLRTGGLQNRRVRPPQGDRQGVLPERQAVHLKLPQRLAEHVGLGLRRLVLQRSCSLRRRISRRGMGQHAVALLVVVASGRPNPPGRARAVLALPLDRQIQFGVEIENAPEQIGPRGSRRVHQRVALDALVVDEQVVPVRLQVAERELPVQAVRRERSATLGRPAGVDGEGEIAVQVLARKRLQRRDVRDQPAERRHGALEPLTGGLELRRQDAPGAFPREPQRGPLRQAPQAAAGGSRCRNRRQAGIPPPVHGELDREQSLAQQVVDAGLLRAGRQRIVRLPPGKIRQPALARLPPDPPAGLQGLEGAGPAQRGEVHVRRRPALEGRPGEARACQQAAALGEDHGLAGEAQPGELGVERQGLAAAHPSTSPTTSSAGGPSVRRAGS